MHVFSSRVQKLLYVKFDAAAAAHLQLLLIKVLEPLQRHHLVEAVQEGLGLGLHPAGEPPLRHQAAGGDNTLLAAAVAFRFRPSKYRDGPVRFDPVWSAVVLHPDAHARPLVSPVVQNVNKFNIFFINF